MKNINIRKCFISNFTNIKKQIKNTSPVNKAIKSKKEIKSESNMFVFNLNLAKIENHSIPFPVNPDFDKAKSTSNYNII